MLGKIAATTTVFLYVNQRIKTQITTTNHCTLMESSGGKHGEPTQMLQHLILLLTTYGSKYHYII